MTITRAETVTGGLAGTATVAAYLTGAAVGQIGKHPTTVAVLALTLTIAHASAHRLRRRAASGRTTA